MFFIIKSIDESSPETSNQQRIYGYDDLYIWSTLVYNGEESRKQLINLYWSKCEYPLACSITTVVLYEKLKDFIHIELKETLELFIE